MVGNRSLKGKSWASEPHNQCNVIMNMEQEVRVTCSLQVTRDTGVGGGTETGIGERMGMCEWQLSAEACEKNLWTYVTLCTNVVFLFFT